MKICSFLPTATEMICALGLGSSLVGRTEHCTWPPQVKRRPIVVVSRIKKMAKQDALAIHRAVLRLRKQGVHQFEIQLDRLKELKPDLVLTQNLCSVCAAAHPEITAAIRQMPHPPKVVTLQVHRFDHVFSELKRLGRLTGKEERANRVIRRWKERLNRIQKAIGHVDRKPRVWCCEWLEPLMAAGHWIPEMVQLAGGKDSLAQVGENSKWITWDQVRSYDPEIILVMPCSYSLNQTWRERHRLTTRKGWKSLTAVRQGNVFAVDGAYFHHAGPRLVSGVELMAHLFHPDRVKAGNLHHAFRPLAD